MSRNWRMFIGVLAVSAYGLTACFSSESLDGAADTSIDLPIEPVSDSVEADSTPSCPDSDGDGYRNVSCGGTDCDDTDPLTYPDAEEICGDGIDQDCDGISDNPTVMIEPVRLGGGSSVTGSLLWTGSWYAATWSMVEDDRDPPLGHLARLDGDGEIVAVQGLGFMYQPRIAWTGSRFGLIYKTDASLYLGNADEDGVVWSLPWAIALARPTRDHLVVWTGEGFAAVWAEQTGEDDEVEVYSMFTDEFGIPASDRFKLSHYDEITDPDIWFDGSLDATWTGDTLVVVWNEMQWAIDMKVILVRVSSSGTDEVVESPVEPAFQISHLDVEWTGSELGLAWMANRAQFASLTPWGISTHGPVEIMEDAHCGFPSLAWTGSGYGVLMHCSPSGDTVSKWVLPMALDGTPDPPAATIPHGGEYYGNELVTWTGSEFGVVWTGGYDGSSGLWFSRIGLCE